MKKLTRFFVYVAYMFFICSSSFCAEKKDISPDTKEFYKEVEHFADAVSLVRASYVKAVPAKDLMSGAMKGLMSSLDDYSQYMEPSDYQEIKEETKGEFGGLGVEIGIRNGVLTIITPIDGTPADKAGLEPNDVVVEIENEVTKNMTVSDAVKRLRGKPGTTVNITVYREKDKKFLEVPIIRDIISVKSIRKSEVVEGLGYIKLTEFQDNTASDLDDAMKELVSKNIKGLILDLRYNAGGLLNSGIAVSELFLKKGMLIVSLKSRLDQQNKEYKCSADSKYKDIPLVVLVNEGSASASEIVAGAMKDNDRAVLVGQRTFGKGSVQTVIPLGNGSALRLTTAAYFTPSGVSIHEKGITPDILVAREEKKKDEEKNITKKDDIFNKLEHTENEAEKKLEIDNQMKTAMDVLKTLILSKTLK